MFKYLSSCEYLKNNIHYIQTILYTCCFTRLCQNFRKVITQRKTLKSVIADHEWKENGDHQFQLNEVKITQRTSLVNKATERISAHIRF